MIDYSIFKSYDIRGIYPKNINKKTAYLIGKSLIRYTKKQKIVIGRDMRISSPILFKGLTEGITSEGAKVYDLGKIATECLYFAVGNYNYELGVMITASHNPKEYNGLKIIQKNNNNLLETIPGKNLIKITKETEKLEKDKKIPLKQKKGIKKINIWQDYLNYILSFVSLKDISHFKIVIDASNGMAGKAIPMLTKKLPFLTIIPLNFKLDGNFPAHSPNPLSPEAPKEAGEIIKKEKADFGFIFDGDADRIFLIDEKGKLVRGDITLLLLAKHFLEKEPGKGIIYNLICSKAVPEFIKKWGGRPIRSKVGFVNISELMIKKDAIMGGELAGHFSFKDYFCHDSAFITFLILLEIISKNKKPVSKLTKELSPYFKLPEINFRVSNKELILKEIKKKFSDAKQDYLDGITVEYSNWWFNIRPSQTEPLLRLTIEANNKNLLKEKKKMLVNLIKEIEKIHR